MTKIRLIIAFAICAMGCATTQPKPATEAVVTEYANTITANDNCMSLKLCDRYKFTFEPKQTVTVTANSESLNPSLMIWIGSKMVTKQPVSSPYTLQTDFSGRVTVLVGSTGTETGAYVLTVNSAHKTRELPMTLAEKEALREKNLAAAKSMKRTDYKKLKEERCEGNEFAVFSSTNSNDRTQYRFCDGVSVFEKSTGEMSLSRPLSGRKYEDFVRTQKERLEVAEHNYSVLKTETWQRRAAQERTKFEARVEKYVKKFMKSEKTYYNYVKKNREKLTAEVGE